MAAPALHSHVSLEEYALGCELAVDDVYRDPLVGTEQGH
jgi:hypothetical protein